MAAGPAARSRSRTRSASWEASRARALEMVEAAKDDLPDLPQRRALELVADGVVERYS